MSEFVKTVDSLVFVGNLALPRMFELVHEPFVLIAENRRHHHADFQLVVHLFLLVAEEQVDPLVAGDYFAVVFFSRLNDGRVFVENKLLVVFLNRVQLFFGIENYAFFAFIVVQLLFDLHLLLKHVVFVDQSAFETLNHLLFDFLVLDVQSEPDIQELPFLLVLQLVLNLLPTLNPAL